MLHYSYWMNSFFIILSCVRVWVPLFALMELINLLSSYHEIEHYHYHELWFTYCNICNNFFHHWSLKMVWRKTFEMSLKIKNMDLSNCLLFFLLWIQDVIMWSSCRLKIPQTLENCHFLPWLKHIFWWIQMDLLCQ